MLTINQLAEKLIKVETQLNELKYDDVNIGSLLAYLHINIYQGKLKKINAIELIILLFREISVGFFIKNEKKLPDSKEILLHKVAVRNHFNHLVDPIKEAFYGKCIYYEPSKTSSFKHYSFYKSLNVKKTYCIISFILKNYNNIKNLYKINDITICGNILFYTLFIQLVAINNWINILSKSKVKLVVVDFDRKKRASCIVLAAKKNKIHTISLQHGVINPPYGFYPVIADEILVWGDFHKEMLISFGQNSSTIKVVGNPMAQIYNDQKKIYNSNKIINIGVALNPIDDKINKEFVKLITNYLTSDKIIIKLHPTLKKEKWMYEVEKENVKVIDSETITNAEFFNSLDILIVGNSGIGYEALINKIPLWIYKVSLTGNGHDQVMITYGNCPDITNIENLSNEYFKLKNEKCYLKDLYNKEIDFVNKKFYADTGKNASDKIITLIARKFSKTSIT